MILLRIRCNGYVILNLDVNLLWPSRLAIGIAILNRNALRNSLLVPPKIGGRIGNFSYFWPNYERRPPKRKIQRRCEQSSICSLNRGAQRNCCTNTIKQQIPALIRDEQLPAHFPRYQPAQTVAYQVDRCTAAIFVFELGEDDTGTSR